MVESSSKKRNKRTNNQENQTDPVINERLLESTDPIKSSGNARPSIGSIALGAGAVATTAGIATMAARARKQGIQTSSQFPGAATGGQSTQVSGSTLSKGVGILAAGTVGAAATKTLTNSKRSKKSTKTVSTTARKSTLQKNRSRHPGKQRTGYDWVSDRRVKGGGYWRKKRPKAAAIVADIGKKVKKKAVAKVKRKGRSFARGIGRSIARTLVTSVAATAAGAGLKAIMERARRNQSSQAPPVSSNKWGAAGKKAAIVAAEAAGATAGTAVAAELIRRSRRPRAVNIPKPPKEDTPPGANGNPKAPKSPNSPSGFNAPEPPEEDAPPGSSKTPRTPKSPVGGNSPDPDLWDEAMPGTGVSSPSSGSSRPTSVSAGTAVMQRRANKTGTQIPLPQSARIQQGVSMPGVADPWEGEVDPLQVSGKEKTGKPSSSVPPSLALPSASRRLSKAQLKKAISESRDLKSKRKRTETEIEKANNKIELGKSLQKKESDADKLRGIDYEMIASEKKANLEARLSEIESRQKQLNELLSPKPPSQIGFTPLSSEGTIAPVPKGVQVIEERKQRKKTKEGKGGDTSASSAKLQEPSPVQTEETVKAKKPKRSIVQRVTNVISRKKKEPPATQEREAKETPRERRRRERAENKQLKQELIEQAGKSASKAMVRNAYKTPLNLVVPGLGDAIEKADKFFGDKSRIEKWAQELEDNGDINISRRQLFRGGRRFVAKQTVAKPKGITQELRRGAEISKDFFDQLVGGNSDEIILKGAKNRGFGAERGRKIQLTKAEYERITATYTNPQKRELLNFLQFIGFPVP